MCICIYKREFAQTTGTFWRYPLSPKKDHSMLGSTPGSSIYESYHTSTTKTSEAPGVVDGPGALAWALDSGLLFFGRSSAAL